MCWGWILLPIYVIGSLLCRAWNGRAVRFVGAEDAPSCPRGGGFATNVSDVSTVIDRRNCGESRGYIRWFPHAHSQAAERLSVKGLREVVVRQGPGGVSRPPSAHWGVWCGSRENECAT